MSEADPRRAKAATCEDWDEATQTTLPGSRTTANVAVKRDVSSASDSRSSSGKHDHDSSDSDYSSKADNFDSMPVGRKRGSDLKINTTVMERERQPYLHSATTSRPEPHRSASIRQKEKEIKSDSRTVKSKPFVHERGICWVCDQYGAHIDIEKEVSRSSKIVSRPSLEGVRQPSARVHDGDTARPSARRMSSNRDSRPMSMYAAPPVQPVQIAYAYGPPLMNHNWPSAGTPIATYSPIAYQYAPPTPITASYTPLAGYFEPMPAQENMPPKPSRRLSGYASYEKPVIEHRAAKTSHTADNTSSYEKRPPVISHRSSQSIDVDRAMMPPPPKPQPDLVLTHRPSNKRSQTYHNSATSNRRSHYYEDDDVPELRSYAVSKESYASASRLPPSAYRGPPNPDIPDRPRPSLKSKSYSSPSGTTQVASSAQPYPMQRRTTIASTPTDRHEERHEADAEAYQRKRSSMTSNDLTAEALKKYTHRAAGANSETGSTASHRSHHSSSKDSSGGRGRATTTSAAMSNAANTNITFDGISLSIPNKYNEGRDAPPVKIDLGGITISMNANDKDKDRYEERKDQKRIERAPSVTSKTSRRSFTGGSAVSSDSKSRGKEVEILTKEIMREPSRRPSYVDDRDRDRLRESAKSSRQHSRATSHARHSVDYGRRDNEDRRISGDHGRRDEYVYGG